MTDTIQTASEKLIKASNDLSAARKAEAEMSRVVFAEQSGFDRLVPLADAVKEAYRAQEWASALLVKAIRK